MSVSPERIRSWRHYLGGPISYSQQEMDALMMPWGTGTPSVEGKRTHLCESWFYYPIKCLQQFPFSKVGNAASIYRVVRTFNELKFIKMFGRVICHVVRKQRLKMWVTEHCMTELTQCTAMFSERLIWAFNINFSYLHCNAQGLPSQFCFSEFGHSPSYICISFMEDTGSLLFITPFFEVEVYWISRETLLHSTLALVFGEPFLVRQNVYLP